MSSERRSLRILFAMRHLGSFRMYESVIRDLAARGHRLHLVLDRKERLGWQRGLDELLAECPSVTWSWASRQRNDHPWFELSRLIALWLDYLRYFEPQYDAAPILRRRAADLMPAWVVRVTDRWCLGTRAAGGPRRVLRWIEQALPRSREVEAALASEMPDVMLITPLIYLGSPQVEMLRSAKALGIPTALCVGSWDHLSSKAVIRDAPHRVMVWNETQREEAVVLHGVPPDRVVVTGAQCYDRWFGRAASRTRDAFCARVGLAPDRPFLLYVGSALFWGSPSEAEFVLAWIESLRRSDSEALRTIGVMIRPHPTRRSEWNAIDLTRFERVTLYGSSPVDHESRNDYFDSLYHSAGVVGLNTSAFLEAAIVGRPVHALLPEQFRDNQEGTLHFHYLLTVGGGVLLTARDFETHHRQILQSLSGRADNSRFVEAFIRPGGLDVPATTIFVDAVERLGFAPQPAPEPQPAWALPLRVALLPIAVLTRLAFRSAAGAHAPGERTVERIRQGLVPAHDRLVREMARERKLEAKRLRTQLRQEYRERHERERERTNAAVLEQRERARADRVAQREAALERDRRDKARRTKERERAKRASARRKRRAELTRRIMARLGLA